MKQTRRSILRRTSALAAGVAATSTASATHRTYPAWSADTVYTDGDRVVYDGSVWEADWWTRGDEPGSARWGPWNDVEPVGDGSGDGGDENGDNDGGNGGSDGEIPTTAHGPLQVCDTDLCDENGDAVQLRGMSTHGLQWYGDCLTDASLDALATDWNADVLRISLYVQEGGYETDPDGFTDRVNRLVDAATERGLYALVDWHQLTPGDPWENVDLAKRFFRDVTREHGDKSNVIYDVANEPNHVSWSRIREYAHEMVPVLREHDPDAVILCGTHGWASLGVSDGGSAREIVDDPVDAENFMYTFHFYANSHGQTYRDELAWAADRIPVFVTEWGAQEKTGDGPNDFDGAQAYLDLMAEKNISWVNWNYSDDHRSGAAWTEGTCPDGPWTEDNLKPSGRWVREALSS